jgi:hypothetical protein
MSHRGPASPGAAAKTSRFTSHGRRLRLDFFDLDLVGVSGSMATGAGADATDLASAKSFSRDRDISSGRRDKSSIAQEVIEQLNGKYGKRDRTISRSLEKDSGSSKKSSSLSWDTCSGAEVISLVDFRS